MRKPRHALALTALASAACAALVAAVIALVPPQGGEGPAEPRQQAAAMLRGLIDESAEADFGRPPGDRELSFPADHGGHPGARAETWTLAAHLEDGAGRAVGVQLSLARFGVRAAGAAPDAAPWALSALHRGHAVLVRADDDGARAEERLSRGAAGASGHAGAPPAVWLDDWSIAFGSGPGGDGITVSASPGGTPVRLTLRPVKGVLRSNGDGGAPFRGYAMPRLAVEGAIGAGDGRRTVAGTAWLDHLWGELPLPGGPVAYDRLVLHLDDGSDLSLVRSRRRDGRGGASAEGVLVTPDGTRRTLPPEDLSVEARAHWTPPDGGGTYPLEWRVRGHGLDLRVAPVVEDQLHHFTEPLWSGLVTVEGSRDGAPVSGAGTLQLTGYADR
jgi:predicted secreted hydrolase